jgi:excisionase family DNA binding protein
MTMAKAEHRQGDKLIRSARELSMGDDSIRLTITVEDAARILGISRGAAYTCARDGSLPTIRLGKRLLVPKAAIQRMLMLDLRDEGQDPSGASHVS